MTHPARSSPPAWYVVHTKPKQEFRALEQLGNQGYECFLPTLRIEKVRRSCKSESVEPLFSRYLFIRLDGCTNWSPIRSTRGVTGLVEFGGRFATLGDDCVEALRSAPQHCLRTTFSPGEKVSVVSGPLAGIEGAFQEPDGEVRALILIDMMSQPRKLSIAMELLRKAA